MTDFVIVAQQFSAIEFVGFKCNIKNCPYFDNVL